MLKEFRQALREQILASRDAGFLSEAEQHARAGKDSIYELCHDRARYPLEAILAMADLASLLKPQAVPQLKAGLKHRDSAVRYWAAMGLLMRGQAAVVAAQEDLRSAIDDPSPSVRIVVAQALWQFGDESNQPRALSALATVASPKTNGAYVAIHALGAIESLGDKAAILTEELVSMTEQDQRDPTAPARANTYVPRILKRMKEASRARGEIVH